MKTIVLATSNEHKLKEIQTMLEGFDVVSLKSIGFTDEIEETGKTTGENAKIKAMAVLKFCKQRGLDYGVLSDDAGLFVNALGGEPGVYSARYAGDHDMVANRKKLLENLGTREDRTAYFECTLCYADKTTTRLFVGRTYGTITTEEMGENGFGYDPLFYSSELNQTFAEATEAEKDSVSHRGRAIEKFKHWAKHSNPNYKYIVEYNKK